MKWLIACEESATVRDALRALGHDAWSCDILQTRGDPRWHIQRDVREVMTDGTWDGMIAHPVCTKLANSGSKHLYIGMKKENGRDEQRWRELEDAAAFYRAFRDAPIHFKAIENPVMHGHAIKLTERGKTQFVHPYFFGEPFFKMTGLELFNLPPLVATNKLTPPKPKTEEHKAWSACHRAAPGPNRARDRSKTYQGIANAMASQWGDYIRMEKAA